MCVLIMSKEDNLVRTTIMLHKSVKKELQHKGIDENRSLGSFIREAVYNYYNFDENHEIKQNDK